MIDQLLNWGIQWTLAMQGLGSWLAGPMEFFTFLGNEDFFIFFAPAFLWCFDARLGLRMGLLLMTSSSLNSALKLAFTSPRPFWIDPRIQVGAAETSFGLPSGHAQNAASMWGLLAAWARKSWFWLLVLATIFMIGISRVYLGVHLPGDVLVGWAVGALLLMVFLAFEKPILKWLEKRTPSQQILAALAGSVGMILLNVLIRLSLGDWRFPSEWLAMAAQTAPDFPPPTPLALSGVFSTSGVFFGLAAGWIWTVQGGGFDAGGPIGQRAIRFLIGLVGVAILWQGLGLVLPRGETIVPYILRYLRYGLMGLWVAGVAPYLFIRFGLAERFKS